MARDGAVELVLARLSRLEDQHPDVIGFSRDLRPSILDDLGLLPAIEWATAEMTGRGTASVRVRLPTGDGNDLSEAG